MKGLPLILANMLSGIAVIAIAIPLWILGGHKPFKYLYEALNKIIDYNIKEE